MSGLRKRLYVWAHRNIGRASRRRNRANLSRSIARLENLESRIVLNAVPVASPDSEYVTEINTTLTVNTTPQSLLSNDWDPDEGSLSASVVDGPHHGALTTFNSDGTFVYVPDTGYTGFDSFTYRISDGTDFSNIAMASIAVGGQLGPRMNLEDRLSSLSPAGGFVEYQQLLTPSISLKYNSATLPNPIIAVDTFLKSSSSIPDSIDTQLTFNGSAGTTYSYDTTGLAAGDGLRFALQADATSLSSGRYDYEFDVVTTFSGTPVTHTFEGQQDIVNRMASSNPFGRGWQLEGIDELIVNNGALWARDSGESYWFEDDGSGNYLGAEGDLSYSQLQENLDGTFTLTDKYGTESHFDSSGKLTSRVDRNGNTNTFTYSTGFLSSITDAVGRTINLSYTSGRLTSVTDFAGRTASLTYDGSGRLTLVTQPDPDGTGPQTSPNFSYSYDATSHILTSITNPLSGVTSYDYGSHQRLETVTLPDTNDWTLTPTQVIGLPSTTTGNTLVSSGAVGSLIDERGKESEFETDRFGNIVSWTDPLGNKTLIERDAFGHLARLTQADPDGVGSAQSPVSLFGYDPLGNPVFNRTPRGYENTGTFDSTFSQPLTVANTVGETITFTHDSSGNLLTSTDPDGNVTTLTYGTAGRLATITTPDPDGAGSLTASTTSLTYDTYGRITTITYPDSTTTQFTYDSADNLIEITDELGNDKVNTFDALNRLISVTDRESTTKYF